MCFVGDAVLAMRSGCNARHARGGYDVAVNLRTENGNVANKIIIIICCF